MASNSSDHGAQPGCQFSRKSSMESFRRRQGLQRVPSEKGSRLRSFGGLERCSKQPRLHHSPPGNTSNASFQPNGSSGSLSSKSSGGRLPSAAGLRRHLNRTSSGNLSVSSNSSSSLNWSGSAVIQVAQRSNGASVKAVIAELQKHCEAATEGSSNYVSAEGPAHVPLEECGMLALWAVDAYYKVLISKYGGIEATVTAMKTFPEDAELQAYCCTTLKHMSNKVSVQQAGGVHALGMAMKCHPKSIHVQSEACEALKSQDALLSQEPTHILEELLLLVSHAKEMYLTQAGRTSAEFLSDYIVVTLTEQQPLPTVGLDAMDMDAMDIEITAQY